VCIHNVGYFVIRNPETHNYVFKYTEKILLVNGLNFSESTSWNRIQACSDYKDLFHLSSSVPNNAHPLFSIDSTASEFGCILFFSYFYITELISPAAALLSPIFVTFMIVRCEE
jgi:hypothetical protein